jgi:flagellin FlaB
MIAFVIVAAALAFVVLNMGFSTTQKTKTTISAGLSEASSAMEVSGKVTGIGCTSSTKGCTTPYLNVTAFPIKVAAGGDSVNLANTTASIKYLSNSVQYDNIFAGTIPSSTYVNVTTAFTQAKSTLGTHITLNPVTQAVPSNTKAIIYWTVNSNSNSILDQGEHAVVAIAYKSGDRPTSLDKIRTEIVVPSGSPLTVERQVPNITSLVVDLG